MVVKNNNSEAYKEAIEVLLSKETKDCSEFNKQRAFDYEIKVINNLMFEIYGIG